MPELKNILLQTVESTGLVDDVALIASLGKLAANWVQLAAQLDDFDSAPAFLRAIAEQATSDAIRQAFEQLQLGDLLATLEQHAAALKSLLDNMPETVARLLQPVGAFDERQNGRDTGRIAWPIVNKTLQAARPGEGVPAYALSLGVAASVSLEAGDTWPYSDPMPEALLRIGASGSLTPTAGATLPFTTGQASATAHASATCALEYYYAVADPGTIYAAAAGQRLAALPDPFDFDSIWTAFESTDLAGIHYAFEGSGELKATVSMADAAALGPLADIQFGASVTVGFSLSGTYFLTFRAAPRAPGAAPQIVASLSRQRSSSSTLGANLGVTIDAAPLARKVHQILAGALARWDDALKDIKPLLSPGTWLQAQADDLIGQKAQALIGDAALRAALIRDLQGVIGVGELDDPALVGWLSEQLAGAVDSATGWAKDRAAAAGAALDTLGGALPAFAQPELRPELQATADALIAAAGDALEAKVGTILNENGAALGKALHGFGVAADKTVADLDAAMAGVRALIGRYETLFRKILAETQNAARAKLSAALQIEESRIASATTEIEGTFLARSDAAREAFEALTRGKVNTLASLVELGGQGSGFAVDPARSSLRRFAGSSSKFGIELVLFDFGVTGSDLLTGSADVLVDGTGKVHVDAGAKLQKRFKGLDAERQIELMNSFSLVQARALAGASPAVDRALGLAVTIGHLDDGLQRHEVERFVGSLVDAGLIAPGALALAVETFTRWVGNPGLNGKLAGSMVLKLALDRTRLSQMLGLDTGAGSAVLPEAHARRIVLSAIANLRAAKAVDKDAFNASFAAVRQRFPDVPPDDLLLDNKRIRRALETDLPNTHIRGFAQEDKPFVATVALGFGMRSMIEELRQIYFSQPELQADQDRATWSPEDYRDAERRATGAVRDWLQLNNVLFWTNSKVHGRTIAFLDTLSELAGVDRATAFSLTMTRTGESPETVVLTR